MGYSGDGGPAIRAQFQLRSTNIDRLYISNLPPGIAVDNTGNVYAADSRETARPDFPAMADRPRMPTWQHPV